MKKLLFFVFFLCSLVGVSLPAAADEFVEVALTPQQTLALYGASFDAFYYNGTAVESVTFDYYTSSAEIAEAVGDTHNFVWLSANWNNPDSNFVADFRATNFLVYRWITSSVVNSANTGYQFSIQPKFSISLSGLSSYKQKFMWSFYPQYSVAAQDQGRSYLYLDTSADSSPVPFASYNSGDSWAGSITTYVAPILNNTYRKGLFFIDAEYYPDLQANFSVTGQTLNLKNVDCYDAQTSDSSGAKAVYLFVSCPVLSDGFEIGSGSGSEDDQINVEVNIDTSEIESKLDTVIDNQESANQYLDGIYTTQTNQLNAIIDQLDAIYDRMAADGDFTVNINTAIDNQTNTLVGALGGLVTDIRGLFVPSSADIINFKADLEVLTGQTFLGIDDAEGLRDQAYAQLLGVQPVSTIDLPLLSFPDNTNVDFALDPADINGLAVQDGNIKVPVKPRENDFGFFYELAAWGIDIIATLLVVNMLLNKWKAVMVGEKVVEIE